MCLCVTCRCSIGEHVGCFHMVAIVNNATVDMRVQISPRNLVCFLGICTQK